MLFSTNFVSIALSFALWVLYYLKEENPSERFKMRLAGLFG
jgi:hypothetical protein